jgi:tetratricopeptide (TPR) repeat protein
MPPHQAFPRAKAAANKALEINPEVAEAYASLGWIATMYDWDWPAAERHFLKAIQMKTQYALAHHWYAVYLSFTTERFDESIREMQKACELEPGPRQTPDLVDKVDFPSHCVIQLPQGMLPASDGRTQRADPVRHRRAPPRGTGPSVLYYFTCYPFVPKLNGGRGAHASAPGPAEPGKGKDSDQQGYSEISEFFRIRRRGIALQSQQRRCRAGQP